MNTENKQNLKYKLVLKNNINDKVYREISDLAKTYTNYEKVNFKLELEYKLSNSKQSENTNEFLYYIDDCLIGYLGICSFGTGDTAELNGMVHPNYTRKGIFTKLFESAIEECTKRGFKSILLLTDHNLASGNAFIHKTNAKYKFSEYRMKISNIMQTASNNIVTLRVANSTDASEIWNQNVICFDYPKECPKDFEIDSGNNIVTYLILLNNVTIGKITVDYNEESPFIYGFSILPNYRGNGYGREALKEILLFIYKSGKKSAELDVECKNEKALKLYKSAGFSKQSSMDYFEYQK